MPTIRSHGLTIRHRCGDNERLHCIWQVGKMKTKSKNVFRFLSSFALHEERTMFDMVIWLNRYNVIANPLEGKLTMPKAIFIVMLIWIYTIPWSVFPYLRLWGRYVPGMCPVIRSWKWMELLAIFSLLPIRQTEPDRGLPHIMHLRLFDRLVWQPCIRRHPVHLQLLYPDDAHHLFLQPNREPRIQPWESAAGAGQENERRIVAIEYGHIDGRSSHSQSGNHHLLSLCCM